MSLKTLLENIRQENEEQRQRFELLPYLDGPTSIQGTLLDYMARDTRKGHRAHFFRFEDYKIVYLIPLERGFVQSELMHYRLLELAHIASLVMSKDEVMDIGLENALAECVSKDFIVEAIPQKTLVPERVYTKYVWQRG